MVSIKKNSTLSNGSVTKNKCSHVDHEDEAALGSLPALSSSNFCEGPARKRTSYKLPGSRPISEGNKGLIHRRQAAGRGRVGPQVSSAKKNKSLDRSGDMGYCGTTTAAIHSGHSSARQVHLNAQSDTGDAPHMGPLNASRRDPESNCAAKLSGGGVTRSSQGYGQSKPRVLSSQSDKQQAEGNGRVGPKGTGDQASGDSRINKR